MAFRSDWTVKKTVDRGWAVVNKRTHDIVKDFFWSAPAAWSWIRSRLVEDPW